MIMKHILFQAIVLILLRFDFVPSQGTHFARIDHNADNHQLSFIGSTQPMHSCSLKNECNYVVKNSENDAMVLKDVIGSTSDYFAVWKKISTVVFTECKEAQVAGVKESGAITLLLPRMHYVRAYCDMTTTGGGWTVIQRRADGSTNFIRNWQDYKQGFGNLGGDFWLGLEAIHQLTSSGNVTLRVDLRDINKTHGFAEYPNTKVHDEATEYRLSLGPHSGSIGNGMATASDEKFSTLDNDNDKSHLNCAEFSKGGWWYYECFYSGLNGLFYNKSRNTTQDNPDYMSWPNWGQFYGGITFSEMKVRRN